MSTTEMRNALHDLDDWIQRRNIMLQHSDLTPKQHQECVQELRTMHVARDALYLRMQPAPYLKDDEFLIVDGNSTELFSKEDYLPTPLPKDCVAAPMNPWIRTNDQPPTEMDACHNDWVLALAAYQSPDNPVRLPAADIVDWDFPVNCPESYPYWMPLPKPPEVQP